MSLSSAAPVIRTFAEDFERLCREETPRRAILEAKTGRVWTYGALGERVAALRAQLWHAGVRPGDRVFSLLPNSVEQLAACFAALAGGIEFCPLSPLSTAAEARRFIRLMRCATGFVPHAVDAAVAEDLRAHCAKQALITLSTNGDFDSDAPAELPAPEPAGRSGKIILFTSGTTASPKAIVVDGDRLWSSAQAWVGAHAALDNEARFYNILPMSYLGGLFNLGLIPLAARGSVVVADTFSALSALRFWRDVEAHGINVLWLSPTMVRSLLGLHRPGASGTTPWKQVRLAFLGMAPALLEEKQRFEAAFGIPLLENYALSETTFLTSETAGAARAPGSVGAALPWATLRLAASGEIEVKTPFLFDGYLEESGAVRLPLTAAGFFATGDLGSLQPDGALVLRGRSKDIIKKGGYLLVLRDLEEVVETHPQVEEAVAVGKAHEFYGETAVLCVRLRPGAAPAPVLEELKATVVSALAKFKWPTMIAAVTPFPRTESGKIQRRALASWLETPGTIAAAVEIR